MNKKILFFVPYGKWLIHHQLDLILAASLSFMPQKRK